MDATPEQISGTINELLSTPPVPKPGVYENVSMADYLAWDCASASRLTRLRQSPAHLRAYMDAPGMDTPALVLGRAIHCAVLEPERFEREYVGWDGKKTTKGGRAEWDALVETYAEDKILRGGGYETCLRVRDAVYATTVGKELILDADAIEQSYVWEAMGTGVLCKARLDVLRDRTVLDLKTTTDASTEMFPRAVQRFGYHRQAALYLDAPHSGDTFVICAVEKEPPYAVAFYEICGLQWAAEEVWELLTTYKECVDNNEWPGYPEGIHALGATEDF